MYEVKISPAIVASAALQPKPRPGGMQGRPLTALLTQGPFLEAFAADFSPAQVAKWHPRPPAVCAHAAAAAFLLPHKGPRGCPGSGGSVRKISSAAALVVSRN